MSNQARTANARFAAAVTPEDPLTPGERTLIEENFGLLYHALKSVAKGLEVCRDFPDAAWNGAVDGFLVAARRFDPARGFKFSTYAVATMRFNAWKAANKAAKAHKKRARFGRPVPWDRAENCQLESPDHRTAAEIDRLDLRLDVEEVIAEIRDERPSAARAIAGLLAGKSLMQVDRESGNQRNAAAAALSWYKKKRATGLSQRAIEKKAAQLNREGQG